MKVRYTKRAAAQIAAALDYVAAQSPQGADRIRRRLEVMLMNLQDHPYAGRPTTRPGVHRLVTHP